MDRKLDGIFIRIQRDGKWDAVCISDMTNAEIETALAKYNHEQMLRVVQHLASRLKSIGDQLDLTPQPV